MNKFRLTTLAIALVGLLFAGRTVVGAPARQMTGDVLSVSGQTALSLNITLPDGTSVVVVPVNLQIATKIQNGIATMDVIATVGEGTSSTTVPILGIPATIESSPSSTVLIPVLANGTTDVIANRNANLRQGPGTNFAVIGGVKTGDALQVVGQNDDGSWLQLANGAWIASFLVTGWPSGAQAPVVAANPTAPQPIATLAPTSTPFPSAAPTSALTVDVDDTAFVAESQRILGDYSTVFQQISELTTAAGNDATIMFSDTWTQDFDMVVATLRGLSNEIRALRAPPAYAASWGEMRVAADKYDQAMDAFVSGIDNLDANQINQGILLMREGQAAVSRATSLLPTAMTTPTVIPVEIPTAIPSPLPSTITYECDFDFYNCPFFGTHAEAQQVFEYCRNLGFGDIHGLDGDNNGLACEDLP